MGVFEGSPLKTPQRYLLRDAPSKDADGSVYAMHEHRQCHEMAKSELER
jgi:hypothetical protein